MKKLAKGIKGMSLIAVGSFISVSVSAFLVEQQFFMLNPVHEGMLLGMVFLVPLVLYEIIYTIWYCRCANQPRRVISVYKDEILWMVLAAAADLAALVLIFEILGFFNEALLHVGISFIISTVFFVAAFLLCKPF